MSKKRWFAGLALAAALAVPLWAFTIVRLVPAKIFTPNGDAVNDVMKVCFDNPEGAAINLAKVYDVAGREVADLPLSTGDSDCPGLDLVSWNGRMRDGTPARGGIYLYRVDADYQTHSGTLVLAR